MNYPTDLFGELIKNKTTLLREHQLKGLWDALEKTKNIKGDVVECGVMSGGASIVMGKHSQKHLWMFDTWEGFPENLEYGRRDGLDQKHKPGNLRVPLETCKNNFKKHNLIGDRFHFVKGNIEFTTKNWSWPISLLRIDVDLYSSTRTALENLEPHLSSQGICIIDDYLFDDCKFAVDEYRKKNKIKSQMYFSTGEPLIDGRPNTEYAGVWWIK